MWDRADRRVWCPSCAGSGLRGSVAGSGWREVAPGASPHRSVRGPVRAASGANVATGGAGASLERSHDARTAAREARVRAAHPRLGRLLLAVTREPASTAAFARGTAGERRLAAQLEEACGTHALFLHNRSLGAGHGGGDLDHVAVTAGGVFVIDAKNLTAARVSVRRSGGLVTPSRQQLWVSGRDRSAFLAGSFRQQDAVRAALAADEDLTGAGRVPVAGVLCFLDATIDGWRWHPPRVGRVHLLSPTGTERLLRRPGPLGPQDRRVIHEHLAVRLPPA